MPKKLFILLIFFILLSAAAYSLKDNENTKQLFAPNGVMYFTKEWSRSINLLTLTDAKERIMELANICNEKLKEIELSRPEDKNAAIENYLKETGRVKLALSSLKAINGSLLDSLIRTSFLNKESISNLAGVSEEDKKRMVDILCGNLLANSLSISSKEDVINSINAYSQSQSDPIIIINNIDLLISYSNNNELKDSLLEYQLGIIRNVSGQNLSAEEIAFLQDKLMNIKNTDYYRNDQINKKNARQEELYRKISEGKWVDEIVKSASPEETEVLENFKDSLKNYDSNKLDHLIDSLEVYEETKTLIIDAKNYIVKSYEYQEEEFVFGNKETEVIASMADKKMITVPENPASAYCLRNGYQLEEIKTNEQVVRNCLIDENNICEEWAFYKGECQIKEVK